MINIMIEKFLFINVLLKNNSLIYHLTTIIKAKYILQTKQQYHMHAMHGQYNEITVADLVPNLFPVGLDETYESIGRGILRLDFSITFQQGLNLQS